MGLAEAYALLAVSALLFGAVLVARAMHFLGLPGLTGQVAVGLGVATLGAALLTDETLSTLRFVEQAAGVVVLFGIGSKLELRRATSGAHPYAR